MSKGKDKFTLGMRFKAFFQADQWSESSQYFSIGGLNPSAYSNTLFGTYAQIYRNSIPVQTVVSFLADSTAAVPIGVYRRLDEDVRESLQDHGLAKTLKDPNPQETQHEWVRDLVSDMLLFDCYFARKVRIGGELLLVRMYPDAMVAEGGNQLAPDIWKELQTDGTYKEHKRDDVFWLHGYGSFRGTSPMEALRREILLDQAESDYRLKASKQGWRTAGVIERPRDAGQWSDKARENFLNGISARYSGEGALAGRPLLLEEDMHWVSDAQEDSSDTYVNARKFTLAQACFAFQLAPQLLGLEGAPYSSIVEYKNQLYQGTLSNKLNFLEQSIEKQLLPEYKDRDHVYVEFNIAAKLRGDPGTQANIAQSAVGTPYVTVNEWRSKVWNLPPVEGGDVLMGQMPPGPPPEAATTPKPSNQKLPPLGTKAVVPGDDIALLKTSFKEATEKSLANLFSKMMTEFNTTGSLDRKKWTKRLTGELQIQTLGISKAVGEFAGDRIGAEYNAAETVNYWTKVSEEQARSTLDALDVALKSNDALEVFSKAQMQIGSVSEALMARAAGWSILELARQNGVIDG